MAARPHAPLVSAALGLHSALPALPALLALAAGCAAPSDDVHLAPLFSHLSTAGAEDEHEALGGVLRTRRDERGGDVREWEVHPLVCHDEYDDERDDEHDDEHDQGARMEESSFTRFLVPLGTHREWPDRTQTQLLPLVRIDREPDENGAQGWRLTAWPLTLWAEDSTERLQQGVFPFAGAWENFATYDRLAFFMFPLYLRTERDGGTYHHLLWPIFGWGHNRRGELDAHLWPLAGVSRPGHSEGGFLAWPLVTWSREGLERPRAGQATTWMFWPFYGERRQQTYSAWNALWPFFGYAEDERSGFVSWAGPWPFVKVQRPGTSGEARISRAWPFYSRVETDGLDSRWYLWPIFNQRHETYASSERHGEVVFPFWDHFVEDDRAGKRVGSWSKLWPLYQYREQDGRSRFAFPTLIPLLHVPDVDEHYGWLWELYRSESGAGRVRERAWLGLWRRERDGGEVREYASGLWSRRTYRRADEMVRETSLLFGLLRWRASRSLGLEFLAPAFPGPGWPAREREER